MAVLPHRDGAAHVQHAPAGWTAATAWPACECGLTRQWRAHADGAPAGGQQGRAGSRQALAPGPDPGHRGLPGRQAGRAGVRIGPRIPDGADAAANPWRPVAGLRAARGLCTALPLPDTSHPAARRSGSGEQRAGEGRAAGGVHHLATGPRGHPPGLAHAVCTECPEAAQRRRLVQPRARVPQRAQQRIAHCQGSRSRHE